jgi:hypothetical protein
MFSSIADGVLYPLINKGIEVFARKALDLFPEKAIPLHCHTIAIQPVYRFPDENLE